jgi:hypothetical protein
MGIYLFNTSDIIHKPGADSGVFLQTKQVEEMRCARFNSMLWSYIKRGVVVPEGTEVT